jgi:hypothetical protein
MVDASSVGKPNSNRQCVVSTFCGIVIFAVLLVFQFSDVQNADNVEIIRRKSNQSVKAFILQRGLTSHTRPSKELKINQKKNTNIPDDPLHADAIRLGKNNSAPLPITRDVAASLTLAPKSNSSNEKSAKIADHKHISDFLMVIEALEEPTSLTLEEPTSLSTSKSTDRKNSPKDTSSPKRMPAPPPNVARAQPAEMAHQTAAALPQAEGHVRDFLQAIEKLDQP